MSVEPCFQPLKEKKNHEGCCFMSRGRRLGVVHLYFVKGVCCNLLHTSETQLYSSSVYSFKWNQFVAPFTWHMHKFKESEVCIHGYSRKVELIWLAFINFISSLNTIPYDSTHGLYSNLVRKLKFDIFAFALMSFSLEVLALSMWGCIERKQRTWA